MQDLQIPAKHLLVDLRKFSPESLVLILVSMDLVPDQFPIIVKLLRIYLIQIHELLNQITDL